jgi:hypothetical protein
MHLRRFTYRIRGRPMFPMLVDVVSVLFNDAPPDYG